MQYDSKFVFLTRRANRFGIETLKSILAAGFRPSLVIVPPSKSIDFRDRRLFGLLLKLRAQVRAKKKSLVAADESESVFLICNEWDVPYTEMSTLKSDESRFILESVGYNLLFVAGGWPELIPPNILQIGDAGGVNLHPSLLPKFRGGDVHRWQVLLGEKESGFTFHRMNEEFDAGEILLQERYSVPSGMTPQELSAFLASKSAEVAPELLRNLLKSALPNKLCCAPGTSSNSPYYPKWNWHHSPFFEITGNFSAQQALDTVRACTQTRRKFPGAFIKVGRLSLIVRSAYLCDANKDDGVRNFPSATRLKTYKLGPFKCGNWLSLECFQIGLITKPNWPVVRTYFSSRTRIGSLLLDRLFRGLKSIDF